MDTWVLRDSVEIRDELRDVHALLPYLPTPADRARNAGMDAYADHLHRDRGIEVMKAVPFVAFGRGVSVLPVIDTVASYLPELTPELLTDGSAGAVLDPGYAGAVQAACETLYEQDKANLEGSH